MSELRDDEILAMVCRDIEDRAANKEAWIQEAMRLADEYREEPGATYEHGPFYRNVMEKRAAIEAHLRSKG